MTLLKDFNAAIQSERWMFDGLEDKTIRGVFKLLIAAARRPVCGYG